VRWMEIVKERAPEQVREKAGRIKAEAELVLKTKM
jgi:hypothetical protein